MIRFIVVATPFGIGLILVGLGLLEQLLNQLQLLCGQAFAGEFNLGVSKDRFGDHLTAVGIALVIGIISGGSGGGSTSLAFSIGGLCINLSLSVMVFFVSP